MVIAVEKGLNHIMHHLKAKGFTIVDFNTNQPVDAVVYQNTSIFDLPAAKSIEQNKNAIMPGMLLVCAYGKTPSEVETILRQKAYANLF